jgi:hypothetical protein
MADLSWYDFDRLYPRLAGSLPEGKQRYTTDRHLEALLRICLQKQPSRILELYTAYGDTTLALARVCPESRLTTIDICLEMGIGKQTGEVPSREKVGEAFRDQPERERITQHVVDPQVFDWAKVPVADLVFIDGDHSYEGVLNDTIIALERSASYSILVWDDYWSACPGVIQLINDLNTPQDFLFLVSETRIVFGNMSPNRKSLLRQRINHLSRERGVTIEAF